MNESLLSSEAFDMMEKMATKGLEFALQHKIELGIFAATSAILLRYGYIIAKRKIQKQAPGPIGVPVLGSLPWMFLYNKLFWLQLCLNIMLISMFCTYNHTNT